MAVIHRPAARRALAAAGMCAVLAAGCTAPPAVVPAPEPGLETELVAATGGAGAAVHLAALQRIADANGGHRSTPGPGYDASVEHVVGVLRAAGWQVDTPAYPLAGAGGPTARNVVAQTRTGDPGRVVMAGAHLDSVTDGPGINDDGTGVAALLEIATRLGGAPPVDRAVRLAFFGSEEDDLQGSTHYVASLGADGRERIALYLNADMLGSPNAGYFVQGGAGEDDEETGPDGSAAVAAVLLDRLARAGVAGEPAPFEGDDESAFVEAGIPSAGVLTGTDSAKTPEQARRWGGAVGEPYDRCYHRACDTLGNVDPVALDQFTDAIAGTLAHFARSDGP